jgi:hypothetical protein
MPRCWISCRRHLGWRISRWIRNHGTGNLCHPACRIPLPSGLLTCMMKHPRQPCGIISARLLPLEVLRYRPAVRMNLKPSAARRCAGNAVHGSSPWNRSISTASARTARVRGVRTAVEAVFSPLQPQHAGKGCALTSSLPNPFPTFKLPSLPATCRPVRRGWHPR